MAEKIDGRTVKHNGAIIRFSENEAVLERDGTVVRFYIEGGSFGADVGILIKATTAKDAVNRPLEPARALELAREIAEAYPVLGGRAEII
jgi:hypothetical protein